MARDHYLDDRVAKLRGRLTEERFFLVMRQQDFEWPLWLRGVRPATYDEDLNGVDAYIETRDEGWIPAQIKSSYTGRKKHIEVYGYAHCIVVLPPRLSNHNAKERILRSLSDFRSWKRRGQKT